jgi:hypothetical protein
LAHLTDQFRVRLQSAVRHPDVRTKTLRYIYDFGDGWEHTIKIERLCDPEPGVAYPRSWNASALFHV